MNRRNFYLLALCCMVFVPFSEPVDAASHAETIQNKESREEQLFLEFKNQIALKISKNLIIPADQFNNKDNFSTTQVLVKINEVGKIQSVEQQKTSGSDDFDKACVQAIQKTSVLPQPPLSVWIRVMHEGLLVGCASSQRIEVGLPQLEGTLCPLVEERMRTGPLQYRNVLPKTDNAYEAEMYKKIKMKYSFSQSIERAIQIKSWGEDKDKKLIAVVGVDIDADGSLEKSALFCPSYNDAFNEAVLNVLKKIKSFSPPPQHLLGPDGIFRYILIFTYYLN